MRNMRLLLNSVPTLLLALLLAVIIWATAVREPDPVETRRFTVALTPQTTPEQIILSPLPDSVQVQLEARQSVFNELDAGQISATVDLTGAPTRQEIQLPITLTPALDGNVVDDITLFPEEVTVELDRLVSRNLPVTPLVQGTTALGYMRGDASASPATVQVTGPESTLEQLAEAQASVFLDDARETVSVTRRPVLIDNSGNIVGASGSNIDINPGTVDVAVPIEERAGIRQRAVTPRWTGDPAPGYRLLSVTVEPSTVLVSGSPAMLDDIILVPTTEIDITGLTQNTDFGTTLVLPDGVAWDDPQPITVSVEIEPITTSAVVTKPPEIVALGETLTATLSTNEVRVFLFGPLEILDTVKDDVRVIVDLFGLGEGMHTVEPNVIIPVESIEARSLQPEQITVQITATEPITPALPGPIDTVPQETPAPTPTPSEQTSLPGGVHAAVHAGHLRTSLLCHETINRISRPTQCRQIDVI